MLQLKYHSYIKSPIKKEQEEVYLMGIASPIINLEKQIKYKHNFFYIPGNIDMIDQSKSSLHNCLADENENSRFPFVCLMEDGHSILRAQSPHTLL